MFVSPSEDEVNVLTSGYSFLLKIFHERGLLLEKKRLVFICIPVILVFASRYCRMVTKLHEKSCHLTARDVSTQSAPSEDKVLFLWSQHSSMINGLHGRYQMYGPVVR
jgi:U3 small nucleolar RNA-associated protein 22